MKSTVGATKAENIVEPLAFSTTYGKLTNCYLQHEKAHKK